MDEVAAHRAAKAAAQRHERIAKLLSNLLEGVTGDSFEDGRLRAVLVVRFHEGAPPIVNCIGIRPDTDLSAAKLAIDDAQHPERKKHRQEWDAERKAEREAYEAAHPFKCSNERCPKRFSTERGRAIHERSCRYIKRDAQPGEQTPEQR